MDGKTEYRPKMLPVDFLKSIHIVYVCEHQLEEAAGDSLSILYLCFPFSGFPDKPLNEVDQ